MLVSPLGIAIIAPLLGIAVAFIFNSVSRLQIYSKYVFALACGVSLAAVFASRRVISEVQLLSLWQPAVLLRSVLVVDADVLVWPVAASFAGTTLGAILAAGGRNAFDSPRLTYGLLGALAAGVLALFSGNVLSMLIGWTAYDISTVFTRICSGKPVRSALQALAFGCVSTALLWAGTLQGGAGLELGLWTLIEPSGWQLTLWTIAAILRLNLYPLSFASPDVVAGLRPLDVPLLMNGAMGWGLWIKVLLSNGGAVPQFKWLNVLAVSALGLGSFLAWSCRSQSRLIAWLPMGGTGAVLLASTLSPHHAAIIASTGGSALLLGTALIALGGGIRREQWWWNIPAVIGGCVLTMLPFTLGFTSIACLLSGIIAQGKLWWGVAFFVHQVFLIPSVARLFKATPHLLPANRWSQGAWAAGVVVPVILIPVIGLFSLPLTGASQVSSWRETLILPGQTGWLLWVVAGGIGGVLAWQDAKVRGAMRLWLSALHDLLCLDWMFRVVVGAAARGASYLRATDEIVAGGGALFWSVLLVLLLVLVQGL